MIDKYLDRGAATLGPNAMTGSQQFIRWTGLRFSLETPDAYALKICYCTELWAHTCEEDIKYNMEVGTLTVYATGAYAQKYRLFVNDADFFANKWSWILFEMEAHDTADCSGTKLDVTVAASGERTADTLDNIIDGDTDTYWQTACGMHDVTDSESAIATPCAATTAGSNVQPFIELTFASDKAVRCMKLTEVPYGVRRPKQFQLLYQDDAGVWTQLGSDVVDTNEASATFIAQSLQ